MPTITVPNFRDWTLDDLQAIEDEDWRRYEIVDGALFIRPSGDGWHALVSAEVRAVIAAATTREHIVVGPMVLELDGSYLIPDLMVVPRVELLSVEVTVAPRIVALVVEIVSSSTQTMDRLVKPAKYAAAGIGAYWRVETDPVSLTAYVLRAGSYAAGGTWTAGQTAEITAPFAVTLDMDALVPQAG